VAFRRKGVKPRLGSAGEAERRSARGRVHHADVFHVDAALEAGAHGFRKRFLCGEALRERASDGMRTRCGLTLRPFRTAGRSPDASRSRRRRSICRRPCCAGRRHHARNSCWFVLTSCDKTSGSAWLFPRDRDDRRADAGASIGSHRQGVLKATGCTSSTELRVSRSCECASRIRDTGE